MIWTKSSCLILPALNLQKHVGEMQGLLDFSINETDEEKCQDLTSTYVKTLKENNDDRFVDGQVVVSLFRLFNVTSIPTANKEEFKIFGATNIQTVGNLFFQDYSDRLDAEWLSCNTRMGQ